MVLVGPSGSGKTTMMRMVAGLEEMSDGTIKIGDRVVNNVPARSRNVAMVFQNYALYPHMTVGKNIGFPLRLAKMHSTRGRPAFAVPRRCSGSPTCSSASRGSFRADSGSASRWAARSCESRQRSDGRSRSRTSMRKLRVEMRAYIARLHPGGSRRRRCTSARSAEADDDGRPRRTDARTAASSSSISRTRSNAGRAISSSRASSARPR